MFSSKKIYFFFELFDTLLYFIIGFANDYFNRHDNSGEINIEPKGNQKKIVLKLQFVEV